MPSEMKESAFYNHRSDVDVVEMMVEVFVHREVQLWSSWRSVLGRVQNE